MHSHQCTYTSTHAYTHKSYTWSIYYIILFIWKHKFSYADKNQTSGCKSGVGNSWKIAPGNFWHDGNILYQFEWQLHSHLHLSNIIELSIQHENMSLKANYTSIKVTWKSFVRLIRFFHVIQNESQSPWESCNSPIAVPLGYLVGGTCISAFLVTSRERAPQLSCPAFSSVFLNECSCYTHVLFW